MLLAEVLTRKRNIEKKIEDLTDYLFRLASDESIQDFSEIDDLVTSVYDLLERHQQHIFTIDRANASVEIEIGSSTTTLAATVRLRETVKRKMDILSSLIETCKYNKNSKFSITSLIGNRDKLLAEYDILTKTIRTKDWTTELTE